MYKNCRTTLKLILVVAISISIALWPARIIKAEIATTRDWIGLFVAGSPNAKTDTFGGSSWVYAGSCSTTPPGAPQLSNSPCNFPIPTPTPGAYQYRMYANDSGTEIAESKFVWTPFSFDTDPAKTKCSIDTGTKKLTVNLAWSSLIGINSFSVQRLSGIDSNSFLPDNGPLGTTKTDTIANIDPKYTYNYTYLLQAQALGSTEWKEADSRMGVTVFGSSCNIYPTTTAPSPVSCPLLGSTGFNSIVLATPAPGVPAGLLSFTNQSGLSTFSTPDKCVIGNKAAVPQYSIPNFAEVKSLYFDQLKINPDPRQKPLPGNQTQTDFKTPIDLTIDPLTGDAGPKLYDITGDFTIGSGGDIKVQRTGVILVEGNLNINTNLTQDTNTTGLVFIVKGDVNIKDTVNQVNAYIVTFGTFCSAYSSGNCSAQSPAGQLIINGSVISLSGTPPKFVRTNGDNSQPAEKVNFDPKYLALLKDIFARTLQIWSEVTNWEPGDLVFPTPTPPQ